MARNLPSFELASGAYLTTLDLAPVVAGLSHVGEGVVIFGTGRTALHAVFDGPVSPADLTRLGVAGTGLALGLAAIGYGRSLMRREYDHLARQTIAAADRSLRRGERGPRIVEVASRLTRHRTYTDARRTSTELALMVFERRECTDERRAELAQIVIDAAATNHDFGSRSGQVSSRVRQLERALPAGPTRIARTRCAERLRQPIERSSAPQRGLGS